MDPMHEKLDETAAAIIELITFTDVESRKALLREMKATAKQWCADREINPYEYAVILRLIAEHIPALRG